MHADFPFLGPGINWGLAMPLPLYRKEYRISTKYRYTAHPYFKPGADIGRVIVYYKLTHSLVTRDHGLFCTLICVCKKQLNIGSLSLKEPDVRG